MKVKILSLVLSSLLLSGITIHNAAAQQKPPAGRSGLDPSSRTKVGVALSRARIDPAIQRSQAEQSVSSGAGGGKSCTTNIASDTSDSQSKIGNRYGAGSNSDKVVVIKGPVVSVCK